MATSGVELATAYVTLAVSTRGMESDIRKQFSRVESQAGTTGTKAGRAMGGGLLSAAKSFAGPLAAAFGVGVIVSQLSSAVSAGSDFQQAVGGGQAVFKKQFDEVAKAADGAAMNLGLSKTAYLELATVLGAGLKNKAIDDFAGATQNLIKTGADLAAQYGGSTKDAVDALSSAMRGENDPIERYGITLNETAIKAEAMALGLIKNVKNVDKIKAAQNGATLAQRAYNETLKKHKKGSDEVLSAESRLIRSKAALGKALEGEKGELTGSQKAQAALSLITKQSADATGAFGREADTFAGKQARLAASWENIKTQVGTALLPALTSASDWFLKKGVPAVKGFADFVTQKLIPGITGISDILLKGDFTGALNKAFGWAEDSGPVDFLFNVRDAFVRVGEGIDTLKGKFADSGFLGDSWDRVVAFGDWLKSDLWPALQEGYQTILPGIREALDIVKGAFEGADGEGAKNFGDTMRDIGTFVSDVVVPALSFLARYALPVVAANIRTLIEGVKAAYASFQFWQSVVQTFTTFIVASFETVTGWVATMLDALSHVPGFGWAKDAADKLRDVSDRAREVKDAINGIPTERNVTIAVDVKYSASSTGRFKNDGIGYAPGRAKGGPVRKGQPYIVGEHRPELFVPDANGKILPRVPDGGGSAGGSGLDYYRLADVLSASMQRTPLAVGVAPVTRAVNQRNAERGAL